MRFLIFLIFFFSLALVDSSRPLRRSKFLVEVDVKLDSQSKFPQPNRIEKPKKFQRIKENSLEEISTAGAPAEISSVASADSIDQNFAQYSAYSFSPASAPLYSGRSTADYQATLKRATAFNPMLAKAARPLTNFVVAPLSMMYKQYASVAANSGAAKDLAAAMLGMSPEPMPAIQPGNGGISPPSTSPTDPSGGGSTDDGPEGCSDGQHNTDSDCWVHIDNNVYDLSKSKFKHSGGFSKISPLCGGDAKSALLEKHALSYIAKLDKYKLTKEQVEAGAVNQCAKGNSAPAATPPAATPPAGSPPAAKPPADGGGDDDE